MSVTRVVAVRMAIEQYMVYEMRAAAAGMKPATYLKKVLDERENSDQATLDELRVLQQKIESMQDLISELHDVISLFKPDSNNENQSAYIASIQTLFLLRSMAKPAQIDLVNNKLIEMRLPTLS